METTLSTVLGSLAEEVSSRGAEDAICIARFSELVRDVYYPSGMNEARVVGHERETADGLQRILGRLNAGVHKGEIVEAVRGLRESVSRHPEDSGLHFKLGLCCLLLNDRRAALEEYKILKKIDPSMGDALLYRWNVRTPWGP